MRQIALYGKGGIGKSTVASHLSYTFAERGMKVLQVGCSPKNDSTYLLLPDFPPTILDVLRKKDFQYDDIQPEDIITRSPLEFPGGGLIYCAESGGPEPGVGCGGKGVVEAIETLTGLDIFRQLSIDVVVYDILGDVVCGGFSLPIRQGYARETYVVTSGEFEALYQVANVSKAIKRFENRSGAQLGGLIVNLRRVKNEQQMIEDFAAKINTQIIGIIPYSQTVKECGGRGETVFRCAPDTPEACIYRDIGTRILENTRLTIPQPIEFEDLYTWWLQYV
ncbi:MAG: AAA family ATPase [Desulfobacterota bacterium]|nr:AAA family ATPase [Thermodesulfobacteriota bacterium]